MLHTSVAVVHFNSSSYYVLYIYYENVPVACNFELQCQPAKSADGSHIGMKNYVMRSHFKLQLCQFCLERNIWLEWLHIFIGLDKLTPFMLGALKKACHVSSSVR